MPFYRPNGEVGGYYSAKDHADHKSWIFFFWVAVISVVAIVAVSLLRLVDWMSVSSVTTILVQVITGAALAFAVIYSGVMASIAAFKSEDNGFTGWLGYGLRMAALLSMIFASLVVFTGVFDGKSPLTWLGVLGLFGTILWVFFGGIVGVFLMDWKAILPLVIGAVAFFILLTVVSFSGGHFAVLFGVPVIAGAALLFNYRRV